MKSNAPTTLIERSGDGWFFRFDTAQVPDYIVLTFQGNALPSHTEHFLAAIEDNLATLADAEGRFYPTIVDLSALPPPSMADIKAGWGMVGGVARRHRYMAFLVNSAQRNAPLFGVFLGVLPRLMPSRFAVTTSLEEAIAAIQGYYQRGQ